MSKSHGTHPVLSFLGAQSSAVKKLLGLQKCDEVEWAEKATEQLIKRLGKTPGMVEALERAIANPGINTGCVTIPRSLDGRLQIHHKKAQPHVLSCRVWRWPDLTTHHELKPLEICMYPYNSKQNDKVCINPYHYERVNVHPPQVNMMWCAPGYSPHASAAAVTAGSSGMHGGLRNSIDLTLPTSILPLPSAFLDRKKNIVSPAASHTSYASSDITMTPLDEDLKGPATTESRHDYEADMASFWALLQYHELNNPVGQSFKIKSDSVKIDGGTDASAPEERICLGALVNLNRNSTIESTRRYIGAGVQLIRCVDAETKHEEIYLECLSSQPIFVQSDICCRINNFPDPTTVIKVPPHGHLRLRVYNSMMFETRLQEEYPRGFEALYALKDSCAIRLSFAKGWGAAYHRKDITMCPCWLQMTLTSPLQRLDGLLKEMKPSNDTGTQ